MWLCLVFIIIISLLRGSTGQSVKQTSGIVTVAEGQTVSLNCSYEVQYSGMNYPFWYLQHPGQPLKLLLTRFNKNAQGFQATQEEHDKKGTFNMQKQGIQLKDSAVYFCAFTDNNFNKFTFGSGTRLVIIPNLKNSNPSVYQLKPKEKQSNLAACLITDYSPDPIDVNFNSNLEPVAVNGSAVVVKEDGNKESASLGVVIWSKNEDQFQCSATHGGNTYVAEKEGDATCSETPSDTPVFETDENLNLLSLTVLGLRLIFFKSVALNLILTFWAWSR